MNAVAAAAFAQYRAVASDWEALSAGVGAMASLASTAEIVVAERDGRIVGAVGYCPPGSTPRADFFAPEWSVIRMLVVDPAARGGGIGRRLTDACVDRARRDRAATIALHTSPAMAVALAMYERMGFARHARVPDRFGLPYGVYRLELAGAKGSSER